MRARSISGVVMRTTTTTTSTRHFSDLFFSFSQSDLHNLAFFLLLAAVACTISHFPCLSLSLSLLSFSHHSLLYECRYITALTFVTGTYRRSLMYMYVRPLEDCFFSKPYVYVCANQASSEMR